MSSKLKNVTFSLPEDYISKLRTLTKENDIPSMNAGVRKALDDFFRKLEKQRMYESMQAAADDPLFLKDIDETMTAYKYSDAEIEKAAGDGEW